MTGEIVCVQGQSLGTSLCAPQEEVRDVICRATLYVHDGIHEALYMLQTIQILSTCFTTKYIRYIALM